MKRAYGCIALLFLWLSATLGANTAHAQDIKDEVASIQAELPAILGDPVRMAALRSAVATLLDYRISTNLLGYEQSGDFGPVWENFNRLMYNDGPTRILARLQAGNAPNDVFINEVADAYAVNRGLYDEFLGRVLHDVFGVSGSPEAKQRLLRAMLTYAIINWIDSPDLDSEWHKRSWTFPFCRRQAQ